MKVGLIGRCEDRGLGNLTREWYRAMAPARTMVVRPRAACEAGLAEHLDWFDYPELVVRDFAGELPEQLCREWLEGLDVVYSAETYYDWRFCEWAREAGVRTVCHVMPEYWKHGPPAELASPDQWWAPTRWRLEHLPADTRVVPVPVALDRFADTFTFNEADAPRWLHVAGARAAADRNGTQVFLAALRELRGDHEIIIRSQGEPFYPRTTSRGVHVTVRSTDLEDYWRLYDGADALVLPRRYGGLSLPALEALGAGLALVMPNVEPQHSEWPIVTIPATWPNRITTTAGSIPLCLADAGELAKTMNWYTFHREALLAQRTRSRAWARENSWEQLRPVVVAELERACA